MKTLIKDINNIKFVISKKYLSTNFSITPHCATYWWSTNVATVLQTVV